MDVYMIKISLITLFHFFFQSKPGLRNSKVYAFLCGTILFLVAALRSHLVGHDTSNYIRMFENMKYASFNDVWVNFTSLYATREATYNLLTKVISELGFTAQAWLAIVAGMFTCSLVRLIQRYSNDMYLSIVMFISLGYFGFSLTGLKQTMAMTIIMWSFKDLLENNVRIFFLKVIMASSLHLSAITFLLAYPMSKLKVRVKHVGVIIIVFGVTSLFPDQVRRVLFTYFVPNIYMRYADNDAALNATGFIIQLFIFMFCYFLSPKSRKSGAEDGKYNIVMNLLFLGLVFQSFAAVVAESFRIRMYYSLFSILAETWAFNKVKRYDRFLIKSLIVAVLLLYYFLFSRTHAGVYPYWFFWQV